MNQPQNNTQTAHFFYRNGSRPMAGNINMNNKRIYNLPTPTGNQQPTPLAFTESRYLHVAGTNRMTNNLNTDNKGIIHLKPPTANTDAATKKYVDDSIPDTSSFIKKDGSVSMTNNLNLGNKKIIGLATPVSNTDAATKKYVDDNTAAPDLSNYLKKDGTVAMTGDFNVGNNKIVGLATPVSNTDAATKKYVDDNTGSPDLSDYLEKDGSVAMTGDLNLNNNKIINLSKPTQDNEAATKNYVDKLVHKTAVQPSHYNNQFAYLMSSAAQWTDEIDTGTSFVIKSIGDLAQNKGNFHNYNHKVIFMGINKNSQGGYKYKMGINFYRLTANADYTLCLEILNTDYELWHKSQISVDKGTSTGLSIGNVSVRKLSHRYSDPKGQTQFMYYHRIIVNFKKLSSGNRFFLHILVNIPQEGIDLSVYPKQFSRVYIITYGILGTFSNIDPDKVYDYHTAFDIKPTEVVYNVDINAKQKEIKNIKIDPNDNTSVATIGQIKGMNNYTINNLYREYFKEVFDFTFASNYGLNIRSSGVVFNSLISTSGDSARNITIPNRTIDDIKKDGLDVTGYNIKFSPSPGFSKYTLFIVFYHWRNRTFSLIKKSIQF